ncbi:MAG TPA: hypothetical protein VM053_03450 [Gemmatimonadaceae bacterium]|nr:hypothetical protein [Gemmatimonadaceae bacterium]
MNPVSVLGRDSRRTLEYLWPAALGVGGVVLGWWMVPVAIHAIGRGGQQETVEWALYMSLLVIFPPVVLLLARGGQKFFVPRMAMVILPIVLGAVFVMRSPDRLVSVALALLGGAATVFLTRTETESGKRGSASVVLPALVAATFGWMAVAGLISWDSPSHWLFTRIQPTLALVAIGWCAAVVLRETRVDGVIRRVDITLADWIGIGVLALFSFRTYPIIEFYHWGFYIGPIEQMRQGGQLLWDTPSQYGLLSILLPTVLPGTSWESFWFFQSVIFAIVGAVMYLGIRKIGRGQSSSLLAFAVVFTTLFFRPRSDSLLLSAQMTPSGGPVRFLPMFVLLAVVAHWILDRDGPPDDVKFMIRGSALWIFGALWSAEAAIYCSAIWFSALAVYLIQSAFKPGEDGVTIGTSVGRILKQLLIPIGMAVATGLAVVVIYRFAAGRMPDLYGYFEYLLLYSKSGFGALPIEQTGSVWFLLLIFFAISMAGALYLAADPSNKRLVMIAALWGGAWSVGSYFTGRSHPVNALSLAPILLFSAALLLRSLRSDFSSPWHSIVFAALVPAFAMPVVLTLGHSKALGEITQTQLAPSAIVTQVPPADASLAVLLMREGVKPSDPVVLIGDGRLMLPPWKSGGTTVISDRSWLPKPYEIIGSLPEARRNVYIHRNRASSPGGWLIHSKADTISHFDDLHQKLLEGRVESRRLENDDWVISWIGRR